MPTLSYLLSRVLLTLSRMTQINFDHGAQLSVSLDSPNQSLDLHFNSANRNYVIWSSSLSIMTLKFLCVCTHVCTRVCSRVCAPHACLVPTKVEEKMGFPGTGFRKD